MGKAKGVAGRRSSVRESAMTVLYTPWDYIHTGRDDRFARLWPTLGPIFETVRARVVEQDFTDRVLFPGSPLVVRFSYEATMRVHHKRLFRVGLGES